MLTQYGINSLPSRSPFVLLNNCDNIDTNNVCHSLVGPDLYVDDNLSFGTLRDSSVFPGEKAISRNNSNYIKMRAIPHDTIFTVEIYLSGLRENASQLFDFYAFSAFCMRQNYIDKMYIGCEGAYDFDTPYLYGAWSSTYNAIKIPRTVGTAHFAAVINEDEKSVTAFVNGDKVGSYKYLRLGDRVTQNGSIALGSLEFFAIRNGDFSNGLQSFTVPTQKYKV